MNKLQIIAKKESHVKTTENEAKAYDSLDSKLLTLFAEIGGLRNRSEEDIEKMFEEAFNESSLLAMKLMFYAGDIREGLGERRTFKICLKYLAKNYPEILVKNLHLIPFYNRFDTLFSLYGIDSLIDKVIIQIIRNGVYFELEAIKRDESVSLIGKWLPSENASSAKTRALARKFMKELGYTPREYRKILSILREYLDVTERKMSNNDWDKIDYEKVPSRAMLKYREAFNKNDKERFKEYLRLVSNGEAKINSSTLYPYDLVKSYIGYYYNSYKKENKVIEEQWKALPNYIEKESNILVMADVSGSMYYGNPEPINSSIGLAIYFAERNKGSLENVYMTFTDKPHFQYINKEDSLLNKVNKVRLTDIGYNTNLEAAFDYLLNIAIKEDFSQSDMPRAICVISDMEIDSYKDDDSLDFVEAQKEKYERAGYKLPKLILWNVEARNDTFLSRSNDIIFVSGHSSSTFNYLIKAIDKDMNGFDVMLDVLNRDRYKCVRR